MDLKAVPRDYQLPSEEVLFEEEIKKSRFISTIAPVEDREQAITYIQAQRDLHPQARHHCWAFVAGHPDDSQCLGFSDDGEPSGTAGKPILAQLQGSGLGNVVAVVVRYSGGIKLGTGGLVKAYGGGVQQALKLVQPQDWVAQGSFKACFDYGLAATVEQVLARHQAQVLNADYAKQVSQTVRLPLAEYPSCIQQLTDACRGQIEIGKLER